jgi:hypothetical protein
LKQCYTVKTNKGYHIYFKYNCNIKTGENCFINYTNVDIRNNGSFIIAPPTEYKLLNGKTANISLSTICKISHKSLK